MVYGHLPPPWDLSVDPEAACEVYSSPCRLAGDAFCIGCHSGSFLISIGNENCIGEEKQDRTVIVGILCHSISIAFGKKGQQRERAVKISSLKVPAFQIGLIKKTVLSALWQECDS